MSGVGFSFFSKMEGGYFVFFGKIIVGLVDWID